MSDDTTQIPGAEEPIPMRFGGEPITDDEARAVNARLSRFNSRRGVPVTNLGNRPDGKDPLSDDVPAIPVGYRLPARDIIRARARAEMEGKDMTTIVREAVALYANSSPGTEFVMLLPEQGAPEA